MIFNNDNMESEDKISIIICSKYSTLDQKLVSNIEKTIGVPYELIHIDNSLNQYSIFQAYNEGVTRAQYKYLCFMHEDVLFHSVDWGKSVIETLKQKQIGMIGVLGSYFLGKYSLSWINPGIEMAGNILQGTSNGWRYKTIKTNNPNTYGPRVAVVDGLWLCIRKEWFDTQQFHWDDKTFGGFHFYDLDMSMQVNQLGLEVQILPEVLIEHKSLGNRSESFYRDCVTFHRKWNSMLPFSTPNYPIPSEYETEDLLLLEKYLRLVYRKEKIRSKISCITKFFGR